MANYAELAAGYSIEYDKYGITAQRQFIESDEAIGTGNGGVTIPVIGDLFHDPANALNHLFCIKISQTYANSDSRKILFTCYYSNEPIDNSNMALQYIPPTDPSELPQEVDYSGEFQLFRPNQLTGSAVEWKWESGSGNIIAQAIPFKIRTISKKVQRIIPESKIAAYVSTVTQLAGKVNDTDATAKLGYGGAGCWLFNGARTELFRDQQDKKAYRVDLTFTYRDPDNTNTNGWQKILNEKGQWAKPYNTVTTKFLYETTSFDVLFA